MFKTFWVTDKKSAPKHTTHDHETTTHHDDHHDIDVEIREDHDHETDIGQIAVDILDGSASIIIVAPIAWVDPAEIDIGLSRNILTISGTRAQSPIYLDAKRLLVEECFYGAFSRSIILPENLAFDRIHAGVDLGVITITIPKLTLISKTIKIEK
jgi:HSP20 family molecular chaperone IbpA